MEEKKKNTLRDYFAFSEVFQYFFRSHKTSNFNLKMMHGINRLSILMFLVALLLWLFRRLT
ncbi:MAG: DUF6728 family protein [Bernardetiaceae bacterium]